MTKKIEMVREAVVDTGYEFYQTIIDFDHPIQIFREAFQNSIDEGATEVICRVFVEKTLGQEDLYIDIIDNGSGLRKENAECFFGLAKSTKVDKNKTPLAGKLGYKGHGTKIFFKSELVEICSKPNNGPIWGGLLDDAVKQIRETGGFKYSDSLTEDDLTVQLPTRFTNGFFLRIKNPAYFKTQHTRYMLNHMYLRDYVKWFSVFGNVRNIFLTQDREVSLHLQGLNLEHFKGAYNNYKTIDPVPEFREDEDQTYERILMGHHFPPERATDKEMEKYAKTVGMNRSFSEYYSKQIFKDRVYLDNSLFFDFVVFSEGYETKRRYDVLLSRKGKSTIDKNLIHTDGERYGFWACKGGVPIEKVDDWILGGTGVGTYTYLHAFIDCDSFELTGTRGSVRNTDLEVLQKIKDKVNQILADKKIQHDLAERQEWQSQERTLRGIEEDEAELKKRFKDSHTKRQIELPSGVVLSEPTKQKNGYSESETLILLIRLSELYPRLFPFRLLDYNTTKGIDFIVEKSANPYYIELKGTMRSKVNHSFRHIYKFICYDIDLREGDILSDVEELEVALKINKADSFQSLDDTFKGKPFTSYQLQPVSSVIQSMEIIVLKRVLEDVLGAKVT